MCEYPAGYVEPYPGFYAKVKAFAMRASELLGAARYQSSDEKRDAFEELQNALPKCEIVR